MAQLVEPPSFPPSMAGSLSEGRRGSDLPGDGILSIVGRLTGLLFRAVGVGRKISHAASHSWRPLAHHHGRHC